MNVNVTVNNAKSDHQQTTMASKTEMADTEASDGVRALAGALDLGSRNVVANKPKAKSIHQVTSRHYLGSKSSVKID